MLQLLEIRVWGRDQPENAWRLTERCAKTDSHRFPIKCATGIQIILKTDPMRSHLIDLT